MTIKGSDIKIYFEENLKFKVTSELNGLKQEFYVDQPSTDGGADAGPNPVDLLVTSLGACVGTMIAFYGKERNLDLSEMRIDVQFEKEKDPYRIARINVDVHYPGEADKRLQKILERVAHTCIIHQTLTTPPEMTIRFPWTK